MPKMKTINKPSITAAMRAYKLTYAVVAKQTGMTEAAFRAVMWSKTPLVHSKTYGKLLHAFEFNVFGQVISVPFIEHELELKVQRKLVIVEQIKASERRRLIKKFITTLLASLFIIGGLAAIIIFGLDGLLEWLK
jgi:hypothetical protein